MAIRYAPVLALAMVFIGVAILSYFMAHYANIKVSIILYIVRLTSDLLCSSVTQIAERENRKGSRDKEEQS